VHLMTQTQTDILFLTNIQRLLQEQFGIEHATIQVEFNNNTSDCINDCN